MPSNASPTKSHSLGDAGSVDALACPASTFRARGPEAGTFLAAAASVDGDKQLPTELQRLTPMTVAKAARTTANATSDVLMEDDRMLMFPSYQ